ncbi:MAG: UDP-N-acetylmuramoyl-L-alanine--D-glutamate ligase [Chloroflexi bacterium]|nr:UDP-N-acetylmuramoyl-L-alanine--D-glutamate ligase [Chloroflexota bacterium]
MIPSPAWHNVRVLIVGAAREGTALARFLAQAGAQVTLNDSKPAEQLAKHLATIQGLPIALELGTPLPDLSQCDILFLSPGVPPTAPVVVEARRRGVPMSSEPRLFTQVVPSLIVGITGSSGKTTTTALTGQMLAAGGRKVWVGGNIGAPLTARLLEEPPPEVAVMELSSFQLELFTPAYQGPEVEVRRTEASRVISIEGYSPPIAAITNITPNHLDRHPSMEDYALAKWQILAHQTAGDWAVLNADNPYTQEMALRAKGHVLRFSLQGTVSEGAFLQGEDLVLRAGGKEEVLCSRRALQLRGLHNVANVLCAACLAAACGVEHEAIRQAALTFTGVPHRLETVRVHHGVTYVNDSIATSPERAIAALRAYEEPIVLLAGGRDKHLPWEEWADLVLARVRLVVAFGEAVPIIERALHRAKNRVPHADTAVHSVKTLEEAVALSAELARPGEVVLLSPGGTSFDAFVDFEARGERFRELVWALE